MKKNYEILLYLLLLFPVGSLVGKAATLTGSDSTAVISATLPDTNLKKQPPVNFITNRIPVKAGDSISITAVVQDIRQKGRFWRNVGRAVVPSLIVNRLGKAQSAGSIDQVTTGDATMVGASLTVIPASIELLQKQFKAKTFVALRAYDEDNQPVTTLSSLMTKAARNEWEELKVSYRVEKDGFVEIVGSKDDRLSVVNFGQHNWLQVSKKSSKPTLADVGTGVDSTSIPGARAGAPGDGDKPNVPGMGTNGGGSTCTAWYWCDGFGCSFMGISCQDNIDYGDNSNGGGGNNDPDQSALGQCSEALNVQLGICYRNFALKVALASAMPEALPAAAALVIEATIENYFCKNDAYQSFDICANNAGFYKH